MKKNPKMGAKLSALKELKKMASGMMGDELGKGLSKKVVVEADDNQGLSKGLQKAKELLDMKKGMKSEAELPEMESEEESEGMGDYSQESESMDEEESEMMAECESPEEIDEMVKMLIEKKKKLMAMKG